MTVCPGDDVILSATGSGAGSLIFYNSIPAPLGAVPMPPATGNLNLGALVPAVYSFGVTESNGTCQSLPAAILVTVGDVIAPTAVCQDINVYLDGTGNATIAAGDLDGGATDNCGTVTVTASQTAFTCADVSTGPAPANDFVISGVIDGPLVGGMPKAIELYVINDIADLSQYGVGSANNGGGTDGEEFTFPAVAVTAGTYIYLAIEAAEFTNYFGFAPDYTHNNAPLINGDDAVELFFLSTVIDVFGDINLDGTGQPWEYQDGWAYRNVETGPDGSTFQLGSWSFSGINALDGETTNATAATPIPIGTYTPQMIAGPTAVTLTVNDGNGNSDDCIAQVTVLDTISPTITCPANQVEFATASCDFTLIDYTAMATAADNCATVAVSQSPLVGTVISGTTTITLTATDGSGNTSACTFDVSLNDTISPTMVCQNINVYLDGAGNATIVAADLDGGSTDNCGSITLSASQTVFTCANIGPNNVTLTVTDVSINSANCISVVTVIDTISPVITCPTNQIENVDAACDFTLPDYTTLVTATEACASAGALVWINEIHYDNSGGDANEGVEVAGVAGTDLSGYSIELYNGSNGTIYNTTPFSGIIPDEGAGAGAVMFLIAGLQNGAPDGIALIENPGTVLEFISYEGSFTATNGTANGINSMDIGVTETSSTPIGHSLQLAGSGSGPTDFTWTAPSANSYGVLNPGQTYLAPSNATITQSPIAGTVISTSTTITMTAADGSGNTSTCTFDVSLNDAIAPTAFCQNINVYLDGAGNASIVATDIDGGSTDNCSGVTLSASQTAFTCADLGPVNVTLTVTDGNANSANCVAVVTVIDTISPSAVCQNINAYLDGAGNVTIIAADIDGGSTDNCGVVTLSASTTAFTCADNGPNNVTLTVDDGNGNTATCVAVVTVIDTISPTAVCQNITVFLDGAGTASIVASDIDNGSTDNCTTVTLAADITSFSCADVGLNTVVLTVTDGSGNTSTCTSTVTVSDTVSPTGSCQNITVFLDGAGTASIVASDIDNGSTDNCTTVTLAADITSFSCADVGPNTVVLMVTDANGNTSTCTSTVTVSDSISPTASCQDITVFLDGTGNLTIADSDLDNGSTDNCTTVTLAASTTAFTCADLGPNTVTLTVTDGSGNTATCTSTVTVFDTVSPTASCQDITVFLDGIGNVTMTAADIDNGSTDNCTTVTLAADITGFTCADLGANAVVLTVTDANGNTSTCTSTVTVSDSISPTASCQDITVFLDGTGNLTIADSDLDNGSTDNCTTVTLAASTTAFTCADLGPNSVTLTVTDGSGNTATCTSTVTVADTISPTISCNSGIQNISDDGTGDCTFTPFAVGQAGSYDIADNCSGTLTVVEVFTGALNTTSTFSLAPGVGYTPVQAFPVGVTNVTVTVTDASGNSSSCSYTTTILDDEAPNAVCQNITVFLDGAGNATLVAADIDNGSMDNCSAVTLAASTTAFTCANVGPNSVTLTVTDGSGNTSTCTSTVTVADTISPTITCPADVVVSNDPGICSATGVVLGTPTTADNCSVASVTDNGLVTYPLGVTNVIWTVTDASGNISQCTQTVTVNDTEAPVLPIILDVNVECGVTIPVPVATDNCAGIVAGTTTDPLVYNTQGTYVINWTFDDGNGNVVPYAQNVIVDDVTAPLVVTPLSDVTDECSVTLTAPAIADNCAGLVTGTTTTTFPITVQGTTVVTWTYDDGNGNISSQNQNVIIDDVTLPLVDVAILTDVTAECEVTTLTPPTAMDNCPGALVGTSTVTLPITAQGTTVVTWMYDDGNGNITLQNQNVIITDVTAPVPDVASLATVTGECSALVTAPTATDACGGIAIVGTTTDPVSFTNQGTYTVTWTYTDANGNSDTQTQTVIVDDVTAPVEDVASLADVTGLCSVTLTAPTATDNCTGTITGTTTTVFPVTATTTVTWTYIDGNGNTSTQDQDVIITGVDVTTTTLVGGVEISANNASGDSYQWIDCNNGNAPVGSGTSQNYIATANGSYAVIINENGCIDTSACVTIGSVGIDDIVKENFNIYPNPVVDGIFTVSFEGEIKNIELQDLQGRIINVLHSTSTGQVNVGDLARGKYFVRVTTATDQVLVKSIIIMQ